MGPYQAVLIRSNYVSLVHNFDVRRIGHQMKNVILGIALEFDFNINNYWVYC